MDPALIARTQDIEHLRMVAQVLMAENRVLYERVSELRADLAIARGEDKAQLELELKIITERLAVRDAELFGSSSERRGRPGEDKGQAEGEAAQAPSKKKKEKKPKKGAHPDQHRVRA